jgi:hypothetical protein
MWMGTCVLHALRQQLVNNKRLYLDHNYHSTDGTLLCVAVCGDGVVKLFVISVTFGSNGSGFTMTSSLATSFHPTGGGGGQFK